MGAVFCLIIAIILGVWRYKLRGTGKNRRWLKYLLDAAIVVCVLVAIVGGLPLLGSGSGPG